MANWARKDPEVTLSQDCFFLSRGIEIQTYRTKWENYMQRPRTLTQFSWMSWPRMSQCSYLPDRDPIKDSKNNKLCISEMCLIGRGEIRLIDKKKKKLWNFIIFMWKKNCFYHNSDLSILRGWSFQISTKNYYFDVQGKKKKIEPLTWTPPESHQCSIIG